MRHSGRDRLVGPKQQPVPSRQRENREQSETWRKKFLASTKCIISEKGGNTKAFQYIYRRSNIVVQGSLAGGKKKGGCGISLPGCEDASKADAERRRHYNSHNTNKQANKF